jgi:hypothetical protein
MPSMYLRNLSAAEYEELKSRLLESQHGYCFICEGPIDLSLQSTTTDIDHVEPLSAGGKDDASNFALAHSSCNRSKQASDLRVARVLAKFGRIQEACEAAERGVNLNDILGAYGGAKHSLSFSTNGGTFNYTLAEDGDNAIRSVPLYVDQLSNSRSLFAELPLSYLHHDERINPRNIGGSLSSLVEEFHRGRPQLHVALAWLAKSSGSAPVRVFDGQHKAAAQVLLGMKRLPVRIFVDPDPDILLVTNTRAGTTLRQVAFDKSVQRHLGHSLFNDRLQRYRADRGLSEEDEGFSESDLVKHFRGEAREMKRYAIDAVRDGITRHSDNKLAPFIEWGGKSSARPLSYSTIEKTFLSFFIYGDTLNTPLNYRADEGRNPRELEVRQVVNMMNIVAEEIFIPDYDPAIGSAKLESKIQKGEDVPDAHLRAHRMGREEVMGAWLRYVRQIIQTYFNIIGQPVMEDRLFQYELPNELWQRIRAYVRSLRKLPVWVNHELSTTVFGGKQNVDYWRTIFETAKAPGGQQVLAQPINMIEMSTVLVEPAI